MSDPLTYYMYDDYVGLHEAMTCSMTTKSFDFGEFTKYKRLKWWGILCTTNQGVTGAVVPITYAQRVTWSALSSYTWSQLSAYTWDSLLALVPTYISGISILGQTTAKKLLKVPGSLRFKALNFKVSMTTDASYTQGPVRLYALNADLSAGAIVEKAVN